jgi:hypothetical protein
MKITMKELVLIGYDPLIASRIMNEICRLTPYETIAKFADVTIKGITTTQYQKLRAVSIDAIIAVCNHKIDHPRSKTAVEKWKGLRTSLESFKEF